MTMAVRGRPFPKGVSGNPAGQPPGRGSLAQAIRKRCGDDGEMYDIPVSSSRFGCRSRAGLVRPRSTRPAHRKPVTPASCARCPLRMPSIA